ncbi:MULTISPECIES: hypothetical protein [Mycolicibacterium]|uniref:hypothetical protein n=1 Tax=Mycolicibacterium TaxID=1866885 RepID=UPI001CDB8467|nr:hypothetical protein [Mycolicibacterium fortuitum]UBV20381.1 hypothetical protein H8Z59_24405 [Mycolicibacterium fortuitum]
MTDEENAAEILNQFGHFEKRFNKLDNLPQALQSRHDEEVDMSALRGLKGRLRFTAAKPPRGQRFQALVAKVLRRPRR